MRDKYKATETPFLSGFENANENGLSSCINVVLSNGDRSKQRDPGYPTDFTHMIPEDAIKKIRSVDIYYHTYIGGFSFFDKDGALIYKIGDKIWGGSSETVEIAENERIIGVKAKLYPRDQSVYSDWQFQIGKFV